MEEKKQRVIQEYVPGRQLTLAHIIANPQKDLAKKIGLSNNEVNAIGILTITPGEAVTDIMEYFKNTLRFSVTEITRS